MGQNTQTRKGVALVEINLSIKKIGMRQHPYNWDILPEKGITGYKSTLNATIMTTLNLSIYTNVVGL